MREPHNHRWLRSYPSTTRYETPGRNSQVLGGGFDDIVGRATAAKQNENNRIECHDHDSNTAHELCQAVEDRRLHSSGQRDSYQGRVHAPGPPIVVSRQVSRKAKGFCVALLVQCYLSKAWFVLYAFRIVKEHHNSSNHSPLLKKACVRQVVLDKWFHLRLWRAGLTGKRNKVTMPTEKYIYTYIYIYI